MIIYNKFRLRQKVYMIDDPCQVRHTIVGIIVRDGHLMYEISNCGTVTEMHEYELSLEINADPPPVSSEDEDDED